MAPVPAVLQRVRRVRQETEPQAVTDQPLTHERAYRDILEAVERAGGEDALDELAAWLVDRTKRETQLPEPAALRERAGTVLIDRGIDVPDQLQSD